ncbi:MAG TPA: ATP-binding cassette domain-containing protein, partial [Cyclobacteriaceae bacterium]|nr:ATP-binding cassette domain-containing protein [Cyclobacteriaceae bacterium]
FVFQFHNLLPEFSALENVMIPGIIGGRKDAEVRARANELLEMLGIGERRDHKPSEMSGGEQQRAAVARALINSPKLLFADEPSGNLDSKNALELHQLFFTLRDKMGQTFVIATHNEELARMADRRLEIKDGMIVTLSEEGKSTSTQPE